MYEAVCVSGISLACVAVVSVSFKPSGLSAREHWAKRSKNVGAGGRGGFLSFPPPPAPTFLLLFAQCPRALSLKETETTATQASISRGWFVGPPRETLNKLTNMLKNVPERKALLPGYKLTKLKADYYLLIYRHGPEESLETQFRLWYKVHFCFHLHCMFNL